MNNPVLAEAFYANWKVAPFQYFNELKLFNVVKKAFNEVFAKMNNPVLAEAFYAN
ncbi:hypothetical protein [Paenibacillus sp. 32O-W]|uniref:hypothetical protein n=1 Tax=Paenibacillus sp. 32O-W TaxID=1695218 RepID=UPI0016426CFD|nr:hypothetical protein [Paenibacillus sp. 32O-W]